jgi:hypothetical protein
MFNESILSDVNTEAESLSRIETDKRYELLLTEDGHIDIKFSDGKNLSSLLPKGISILNLETSGIPESRTYFHEDGSVEKADIVLNYEWLVKSGERGLSILCHELGHPFVVPQTNTKLVNLGAAYFAEKGLPRNSAETVEDVLLATQYAMQELGISLEKELLAWDYGKSYKDLFDISDEVYEGSEERSIKGYVHDWTLHVRTGLEKYAEKFGTLNSLKDNLHGEIYIYDVTTRTYVRKPFSEAIDYLNTFNEVETTRLNNIASSEVL